MSGRPRSWRSDRTTHGHSKHPAYASWRWMVRTVRDPAAKAKGLTADPAWVKSFDSFIASMGPKPPGSRLKRRDPSRGYYPDNCFWSPVLSSQE